MIGLKGLTSSSRRIEVNGTKKRYHPLAFVSFLMAVFLLIPLTDAVFVMLLRKHLLQAAACAMIGLAAMAVPLVCADVQCRRHPERWAPRSLTKVTWTIVILNLALIVFSFTDALTKREPSMSENAEGSR
jgi:protein-S-isoprenylcysteine O-methyltransferase Ste14